MSILPEGMSRSALATLPLAFLLSLASDPPVATSVQLDPERWPVRAIAVQLGPNTAGSPESHAPPCLRDRGVEAGRRCGTTPAPRAPLRRQRRRRTPTAGCGPAPRHGGAPRKLGCTCCKDTSTATAASKPIDASEWPARSRCAIPRSPLGQHVLRTQGRLVPAGRLRRTLAGVPLKTVPAASTRLIDGPVRTTAFRTRARGAIPAGNADLSAEHATGEEQS